MITAPGGPLGDPRQSCRGKELLKQVEEIVETSRSSESIKTLCHRQSLYHVLCRSPFRMYLGYLADPSHYEISSCRLGQGLDFGYINVSSNSCIVCWFVRSQLVNLIFFQKIQLSLVLACVLDSQVLTSVARPTGMQIFIIGSRIVRDKFPPNQQLSSVDGRLESHHLLHVSLGFFILKYTITVGW